MHLINGEPGALLAVGDRGLQYGDGLFETMPVQQGKALFLHRHLQRMRQGCRRLLIAEPNWTLFGAEAEQLAAQARQGVLKLIVTRGSGGRGYRLPNPATPTRIVSVHPATDYPAEFQQNGIHLHICRHRLPDNPPLAGIKHLNRLDQILARAEWQDPDIHEGLMLDSRDCVVEGTMSNVLIVQDGVVLTPPLLYSGVAGIARGLILELAEATQIPCRIEAFDLPQLLAADEVMVCNSVIGLWPVRSVVDRCWSVGPLTRRLMTLWQQRCRSELES
jgi:4-amino-4-deoxychorismate lyase